jgi:glucosyl-3-phosphoglycerate synthase
MADFHQTGSVTTLHRLNAGGESRLEAELRRYSATRPIGLVLPALYEEFETPAMRRIAEELAHADYVRHAVVALGRASRSDVDKARSFFEDFPYPVTVLWIDSPHVQELFRLLEQHGLRAGEDGKGRSCWLSYGYLLAAAGCEVIAVHDCDIRNYERQFLARLCFPLVHPELNFDFAKGYYARVTDRMHGRVTRLFMAPLLRAAMDIAPATPLLHFLDGFRYCLAGEFAMRASLARVNRIPSDWGLEAGVLAEVFRNTSPNRVCQVDLTGNYDHKHQPLSADDASKGLRRMTVDIAKTLFRALAAQGVTLTRQQLSALTSRYAHLAEDMTVRYHADAAFNGFEYDVQAEEQAIAAFVESLRDAAGAFLEDPTGAPLIPNWKRVTAAIPDFFDRLLSAVACDARVRVRAA